MLGWNSNIITNITLHVSLDNDAGFGEEIRVYFNVFELDNCIII